MPLDVFAQPGEVTEEVVTDAEAWKGLQQSLAARTLERVLALKATPLGDPQIFVSSAPDSDGVREMLIICVCEVPPEVIRVVMPAGAS